jgi:hypothetical protein
LALYSVGRLFEDSIVKDPDFEALAFYFGAVDAASAATKSLSSQGSEIRCAVVSLSFLRTRTRQLAGHPNLQNPRYYYEYHSPTSC